jgi:heme/copper-type cytochrome/quinol oxidase subunit 4
MTVDTQKTAGMGKDVTIYVCMLILAAIQFVIGFQSISDSQKLLWMLIVAVIEAALALLFFMDLADNKGLRWFILVFVVALILGMQYGWTDSFRALYGAPWAQVP